MKLSIISQNYQLSVLVLIRLIVLLKNINYYFKGLLDSIRNGDNAQYVENCTIT